MTAAAAQMRRGGGPLSFMSNRTVQRALASALVAAVLVYPVIARQIPGEIPAPSVNQLIVMMMYAVLALGLNIVVGFAGLLDLGYVAFYVIGAYTTALLASPHFDIHIAWFVVVWIAVAAAAISGILLGAPTLRLRGDYLAIVTLGFGEIVPLVFKNLGQITIAVGDVVLLGPDADLTGGTRGINPIDPLKIPSPLGGDMVFSNLNPQGSLYLILAILILTYFLSVRLRDSRLGRAWMAIREDETAAAAMGINTVTTKLLAFALGASFSGFVGAFAGAYQTAIFPESFKFSVSITVLVMVILGGMGSVRGAILGAIVVQYVNLTFLEWAGDFVNDPIRDFGDSTGIGFLESFTLHSYNFLIFGIVLVLMMILKPEGFLPSAARKAELHGAGIAAEDSIGTADDLAAAEADIAEHEGTLVDTGPDLVSTPLGEPAMDDTPGPDGDGPPTPSPDEEPRR